MLSDLSIYDMRKNILYPQLPLQQVFPIFTQTKSSILDAQKANKTPTTYEYFSSGQAHKKHSKLINQANIWVTLPWLCGILSVECPLYVEWGQWCGVVRVGVNGHRQWLVKKENICLKIACKYLLGRSM